MLAAGTQDFSGFRTIVIVPRFRPHYPAPGAFDREYPKRFHGLGAPKNPWPRLMGDGKPVCAATIRVSLGYVEVCLSKQMQILRMTGPICDLEQRLWALKYCSQNC